eukprot:714446_1
MGDASQFGGVHDFFPIPSNGSIKSSFLSQSHTIPNVNGTISYNLYHQISTANVYLKIANRNFNVYRQCFELNKLCIYPGGMDDPIYPNDCIDDTTLTSALITLQPTGTGTSKDDILDDDPATKWAPTGGSSQPPPEGGNYQNCWTPYSQYIVIRLAEINAISGFSSISLGFTDDPTNKHSGAIDASTKPPRWITFAFHHNADDLLAATSDILTDQFWAVDLRDENNNFESDDAYVWTVNPLHFQLDTNPQFNTFRMTQITKGFGLQYLRDASLEYRSTPASTGWYTYAAAYINPSVVNGVGEDSQLTQVRQLAEVACRDIFPTSSPSVQVAYKSGTYNTCWDYALNQATECYPEGTYEDLDNELFYPPAAYSIVGVILSPAWDTTTMRYCVYEDQVPITAMDDWSECNVTSDTDQVLKCSVDDRCNRDSSSFFAMPMGWECKMPDTPEPTTASPTTYYPTTNPTTSNPTSSPSKYPSSSPTKYPSLFPSTSPTKYPTVNPTKYPTTNPTKYPSKYPTRYPTKYPTIPPTTDPTNDPTTDPTIQPTSDPTTEPTNDPTVEPTLATSEPSSTPTDVPSNNPSTRPTDEREVVESTATTQPTNEGEGKGGNDTDEELFPYQWTVIGIVAGVCVCCGIVTFFWCKRKKKKEKEDQVDEAESLAEVVAISEVQGTQGGVEMADTKKTKQESSDSDTAGYYDKPKPKPNTENDDLFEDDEPEIDGIYAQAKRTISDGHDSDDDVISEGEGDLKVTKQVSLEGGDPHVTGGKYGDPIITKGKSSKLADSSSDSDNDADALYARGKRGKSRGGPKIQKGDNDSDSAVDNEKLYARGNRGKSRGGPKYVQKKQESESDSDQDEGGAKKKGPQEDAGVKYGDPVVTSGQNNQSSSDDVDDEFDDNEQYKM